MTRTPANKQFSTEADAWTAYKSTGDLEARDWLMKQYEPLRLNLAKWGVKKNTNCRDIEDAKIISYLAFIKLFERYDPATAKFTTYAYSSGKGAFIEIVRQEDPVARHRHYTNNAYYAARKRLRQDGIEPTLKQIS